MESGPTKSPAIAGRAVFTYGLAVLAAAVVWWLAYYSQYQGLGSLDVKIACLGGEAVECTGLQHFIGPSAIPVYSPMLLWVGIVVTLIGLYLTRRNRAA
jgi:hypothetical protein